MTSPISVYISGTFEKQNITGYVPDCDILLRYTEKRFEIGQTAVCHHDFYFHLLKQSLATVPMLEVQRLAFAHIVSRNPANNYTYIDHLPIVNSHTSSLPITEYHYGITARCFPGYSIQRPLQGDEGTLDSFTVAHEPYTCYSYFNQDSLFRGEPAQFLSPYIMQVISEIK